MNDRETSTAAPAGLRERGKLARKARIMAAARAVFDAKGYAAATTREIAAQAEVGTGTLFAYVRDKRDLLMMVYYDDLERITESSFASVPPTAPLLDQLRHMFAPRYALWGADPTLSRHALQETFALLSDDKIQSSGKDALYSRRPLLYNRLVELIDRAQRAGAIGHSFSASDVARAIMDIYKNESREWVQSGAADQQAGLGQLLAMVAIVLAGVTAR